MVGRNLFNTGGFLLVLFLVLLIGGFAFGKNREPWIAVLLSDAEKAYDAPVRSFIDSVGLEVRIFNLHGVFVMTPPSSHAFSGKNLP
ncbi:MAG: hypothetical protein Kow0089_23880 [Desulfobulbaceae bacterium]